MADEDIDNMDEVTNALLTKVEKPAPRVKPGDDDFIPDADEEDVEDEGDNEFEADEGDEDPLADSETEEEDEEDDPRDRQEEVVVDGKTIKVPISELKRNYSAGRFIDANVQKAVETRKKADENAGYIIEMGKATVAKLKQIDAVLQKVAEPKIDWEELKTKDPQAYALRKIETQEAETQRRLVAAEIKRTEDEAASLSREALKRYTEEETAEFFRKVPAMKDPKKARKIMTAFAKTGAHYGFSLEEVNGVVDHRALLVLLDAARYRMSKDKTKNTQETKVVRKTINRPGSSSGSRFVARKTAEQANRARAIKSGKPDDVAKLLMVPNQRKR